VTPKNEAKKKQIPRPHLRQPCGSWPITAFPSPQKTLFASNASNAIIDDMAALTIRRLDQKTKTRLRVRAAHHGRSMEEEAREILRSALTTSSRTKGNLAEAIHRRFASFGGIEISLPQRDAVRKAPGFEE
jgi:plasmid stability protein